MQPLLDYLFTARPTAVNLGAATRRLSRVLERDELAGKDARLIAQELIAEGRLVADEDVGRNKEMAKHGADWLVQFTKSVGERNSELNVLTVCNTGSLATSVCIYYLSTPAISLAIYSCSPQGYGTALGLITRLFETGNLGKAYFTQTAPYHQGSRCVANCAETNAIVMSA